MFRNLKAINNTFLCRYNNTNWVEVLLLEISYHIEIFIIYYIIYRLYDKWRRSYSKCKITIILTNTLLTSLSTSTIEKNVLMSDDSFMFNNNKLYKIVYKFRPQSISLFDNY